MYALENPLVDGRPAAPRAHNTNLPFHGLGTSKGTSLGTGGTSRKTGKPPMLTKARKALRASRARRGG
ncbi:hypothetical protein [Streptomyces huiliensis]|uniref:hypothetical protein n=1 Tax=Streptomyces huiliensis TaxID=2876027 RepID=UPI0027E1E3B8|nr:hypothetical protein [Streptomyces huiliensis]MBZ4319923.1 hypothetical protein [Streptomyces huiliensis]